MPAWPVRRGALLGGVLALAACAAAILLPLRVCLWLLGGLFFGGILSLLLSGSRRTVPLFCCLAAALFLTAGLWQRTTRADPVEALAGGEDTICGQVIACPRSGRYYTVAVTAAGQVPAGTRPAVRTAIGVGLPAGKRRVPDRQTHRLWGAGDHSNRADRHAAPARPPASPAPAADEAAAAAPAR